MAKEPIESQPGYYIDWVFTIRRTAGVISAEIVVHVFKDGGARMRSFRLNADDFPGLVGIENRVDVKLNEVDWAEMIKPEGPPPSPPPGQ